MLRVLLLLEDAAQRPPLRATLESLGHRVVAQLREARDLHAEVVQAAPDLIIISADSPGEAMLESLQSIAASCPRPVVMFANDPSRDIIRKTVEAGVAAYVVDGWMPERLTPIIEAACARFEAYQAMNTESRSRRPRKRRGQACATSS